MRHGARARYVLALTFAILLVPALSHAWIFSSRHAEDLSAIFERLERKGPVEEVVGDLEKYIDSNPYGESTDEALLVLAGIYAKRDDPELATDAYQRLITGFPASRYKYEALYGLGRIRYKGGWFKDAKSLLEAVSTNTYASVTLRAKASVLLEEIRNASAAGSRTGELETPAIGALLPLKDGYAKFGDEALKGVLLAADVFAENGEPVEVFVRNVGAEKSAAREAVEELAGNRRVVGLVGPLLSSTASVTASSAQKSEIPLITLSQREGVTRAGDYVFRTFLTPSTQARAIAGYAVEKLGHISFAVLYPENNYGVTLADLFEKEVGARGAEVIKKVSYPRGNRDFSSQIKELFGIEVEERVEGRRTIKEYQATIMVDAVYIPDSYEAISMIAPYFEYYNIEDVQLLGSNGWNSPKLVEKAGKDIEGAVFVDGFFSGSTRAGTAEFTARFRRVYGRSPGLLEAQAYDAAMVLISSALEDRFDALDRDALRYRLKGLKGYVGARGKMYFDDKREAHTRLFILTVKKGRIIEVEQDEPAAPDEASGAEAEARRPL